MKYIKRRFKDIKRELIDLWFYIQMQMEYEFFPLKFAHFNAI